MLTTTLVDEPSSPRGDSGVGTSVPASEICAHTEAIINGLKVLLEHHRASSFIVQEGVEQVRNYLSTSSSYGKWLKRSKYLLSYPMAQYLRNDLPILDDVKFKPSGKFSTWMNNRLHAFNRSNTHLWYSWLQLKRVAKPAPICFIKETYDKHLKQLTDPDKGDDQTILEIFKETAFMRVLNELRSVVSGSRYEILHNNAPSTSACFESNRSEMGQLGHICRLLDDPSEVLTSQDTELVTMKDSLCMTKNGLKWSVYETRRFIGMDLWQKGIYQECGKWLLNDSEERLKCQIQAVLEPFKVRVISKGEGLPYFMAKNLQMVLHRRMRQMPCFRLIGRKLCPTDIMDLLLRFDSEDEFFSIDYSAATDGLSFKYSGKIFDYLIQDLPEDQKCLFSKVLGPHDLYYPEYIDTGSEGELENGQYIKTSNGQWGPARFEGTMQSGQLMGSVLSFPILCLANLGLYLLTTRFHQWGWSDQSRLDNVLINGDDMVYSCHPRYWKDHIELGRKVGLEMSVGKAYHHPKYININSTSIHVTSRSNQKLTPYQINYLNIGLLFGNHKVQSKDDDKERSGACSNVIKVLDGCLPNKQVPIYLKYLKIHKDKIDDERKAYVEGKLVYRNLFLPENSGGMGLPYYTGLKEHGIKLSWNDYDSLVIANCHLLDGCYFNINYPLNGYSFVNHEIQESVPYHKLYRADRDLRLNPTLVEFSHSLLTERKTSKWGSTLATRYLISCIKKRFGFYECEIPWTGFWKGKMSLKKHPQLITSGFSIKRYLINGLKYSAGREILFIPS